MDLGFFGQISFTWDFFLAILSIIFINIVLSGDNAVVIALAVRSLPARQRLQGIAIGAGAAVILRVILTFFAAQLLLISFVKLAGGALILWIAVKLLVEESPREGGHKEAANLWHALWIILVADLTMSLDNVLAVAGASKGNLFLLIFGLGMSIPIVVFSANLLAKLMDRYPIIIYIGSAVLGRVGGEMLITDPAVVRAIQPSEILQYGVQAFFTIGVIVAAKVWIKLKADNAPGGGSPAVD